MNPSPSSDTLIGPAAASLTPAPSTAWKAGFWHLFAVQFQGAFSDNLFKFLVLFLISRVGPETARDGYISLVLALFSLPFLLFAMTGGFLADRFPKRSVIIGTKVMELGVMTVGAYGLAMQSLPVLLVVVFLMSMQSAFFGPSKYGSMPEILPESRLSWGNGMIGLGTFSAIITGGIAAGLLSENLPVTQMGWAGAVLLVLAGLGLILSLRLPALAAANPQKRFRLNFVAEVVSQMKSVRRDRVLLFAVLGSVFFWFIGALFGEPTIFVYGKDVLALNDTQISLLRSCLAIGIAVGSVMAGVLSGKKIEYGLVPLGALGLALCAGGMALPGLAVWQVAVLLSLLGLSGGFFMVPINALIQHRPAAADKGSVIAASEWLSSLGIFVAAAAFWLLREVLQLSAASIFLTGSALTLAGTVFAIKLVPDSLARLLLWLVTHTFYRVRLKGSQNLPEQGAALLVCNHVSMADALFVIASTHRPIRFIIHQEVHEKWWVKPVSRMLRTIPITSEARPREMLKSLTTAADCLKNGELVCIFAEGQITRTGQMLPFRRGLNRIMKGVEAPIIPVHLDNVWGSIFSFEKGRFYTKLPHRLPYPVTVSYGPALAADTAPEQVRQAVQELGAEAWALREHQMEPLPRSLIRTARRHPLRFAMADSTAAPLRFFAAFTRSLYLVQRLRPIWQGQEKVGILLPPSVGGALVNHAALLLGHVPVNLNYTLSAEAIASCIQQCGIRTVISSAAFLEKLHLSLPVETVLIEQVAAAPRRSEKLRALALALFCPAALLSRGIGAFRQPKIDDLATIIFSSGSTGDPKGVMLTHYNVVSNLQQINQAISFQPQDRLLGILPFFHSFGFTGTLAAPAMLGLGVAFHYNPTDAKVIGELVHRNQLTFLLATPTFLQIYLRGCKPEQFGSVRFVMVGAEKLQDRLSIAFEDQFGLRPQEAYGCTECAPAVAVNTSDFRGTGLRQVGSKRGSIGHPLPGIAVRIVDPETGALCPLGTSGLMLLKGPNIMSGYLGRPDKTAEVLHDGWYTTGDIASMDEDGFIFITDRLSRFSKIGGEMVPHIKIEERLHELANVNIQTFAVTSLADEKKGEKLMVLHTLSESALADVLEKLAATDLPNLWKPKKDQFIQVPAIPILGTGKTDLRKVRELAATSGGQL
jgi:acyl-[acyl-carrier-protein]-phospholipid O-acyltransferase/long-chain-fatty-acid--[acyl-carrier-protein] ligase